jgi:DNA-binding MarR family transcriptional regulator
VGELHSGLAHKRSTLTSILDRLVERGFVIRETGAKDRRTFVVSLTRTGRPVAMRTLRHLLDLEKAVGKKLPGHAVDTAIKVLAAVEEAADARTASSK